MALSKKARTGYTEGDNPRHLRNQHYVHCIQPPNTTNSSALLTISFRLYVN